MWDVTSLLIYTLCPFIETVIAITENTDIVIVFEHLSCYSRATETTHIDLRNFPLHFLLAADTKKGYVNNQIIILCRIARGGRNTTITTAVSRKRCCRIKILAQRTAAVYDVEFNWAVLVLTPFSTLFLQILPILLGIHIRIVLISL